MTIIFLLHTKGRGWGFPNLSVHLPHFSQTWWTRSLAWIRTVLTSQGSGQGRATITLNCLAVQRLLRDRKQVEGGDFAQCCPRQATYICSQIDCPFDVCQGPRPEITAKLSPAASARGSRPSERAMLVSPCLFICWPGGGPQPHVLHDTACVCLASLLQEPSRWVLSRYQSGVRMNGGVKEAMGKWMFSWS